jgi:hypothetical protein
MNDRVRLRSWNMTFDRAIALEDLKNDEPAEQACSGRRYTPPLMLSVMRTSGHPRGHSPDRAG